MPLALRDLDTGLFFSRKGWVADSTMAQVYPDKKAVQRAVFEYQLNNAEVVALNEFLQLIGSVNSCLRVQNETPTITELHALEEKSKRVITETERLRREQDALLKQIVELAEQLKAVRDKSRRQDSN